MNIQDFSFENRINIKNYEKEKVKKITNLHFLSLSSNLIYITINI